jgi:hypothetical protein
MAVLEDRPDWHCELLQARSALEKPGPNLLLLVYLPDVLLILVFAMEANRTLRPGDLFEVFPRRLVVGQSFNRIPQIAQNIGRKNEIL